MNVILEPACATPADTAMQIPAKSPRRILVVEDEPSIRQLSAQVLLRSGYHVDTAEDGAEGWEALNANSYDLLLTDHNMPRLTGLELVKKVRFARMTLPVILASGLVDDEEMDRHPWLLIAATLLKPFTSEQLLEQVREVLCSAGRSVLGSHGLLGSAVRRLQAPLVAPAMARH